MANIVVYGEKGAYKATNEENYKKAIQNAREIIKFDEFESPEEVAEYLMEFCGKKKEEIIFETH